MGIFDFLRRRTPGDLLRERLFDLAAKGDAAGFEAACRENADAIEAAFAGWKTVPPAVRKDPAQVGAWANALLAIARCLAERLGRRGPMDDLVGTPETNPVLRWQETLRIVKGLKDDASYADAAELLAPVVEEMRRLTGTGVASLLPIALGWIGECRFQAGDAAGAVAPMEEALSLCEKAGDDQGTRAYLANLAEVYRYLGRGVDAAALLDRLADRVGGDEGAVLRRRAARMRAGEPLLRVTVLHDGVEQEIDELASIPKGKLEMLLRRNRITLHASSLAVERGRELGSKGEYAKALAEFEAAERADPYDPDPPYLAALTLLHLDRYPDAVARLEAVERLAPGWFHARSDLWMARGLAEGRFDRGTFLAARVAGDAAIAPEKKLELLDGAIGKALGVPLLHLLRAEQLRRLGRTAEAEAACRAGLALEADDDTRTRLLAELAMAVPSEADRRDLFRQAAELNGHLVAGAMARLALKSEAAPQA